MVGLDRHAGSTKRTDALDHIGIECALGEEIGAADLAGLLLEDIDEELADGLALGFRVRHAVERAEKGFARIHMHQRDVVIAAEERDDFLAFMGTHQAMIDIDTSELVTDGLVDQHGSHRAVDAT